jgi:hypothetical protein
MLIVTNVEAPARATGYYVWGSPALQGAQFAAGVDPFDGKITSNRLTFQIACDAKVRSTERAPRRHVPRRRARTTSPCRRHCNHPLHGDRHRRRGSAAGAHDPMRPNCECCDKDLAPDAADVRICTCECTFCADCYDRIDVAAFSIRVKDIPPTDREQGGL